MRKLFASMLCACVAFTFVGCGKTEEEKKPADKTAPAAGEKKADEKKADEKKADEKAPEGEKK